MKNLIRIFLILTIIGGAVSLHSACSDERTIAHWQDVR